jgi:hypothetical protein
MLNALAGGQCAATNACYPECRLIEIGGKKILTRVAGKDASKQFWKYHNEGILKKFQGQLKVGSLDTKKQAAMPTPPPSPPAPKAASKPAAKSAPAEVEEAESLDPYGDLVPYADPSWYQGVCCPHTSHSDNILTLLSTIRHTSTSLMPLSALKYASGFQPKSNHTLPNGTRPARCLMKSTSKWAQEVIWLD